MRVLFAAVLTCVAAGTPVAAQDYPARTVHMLVPYGPGNQTDSLGRIMADALAAELKQPVVIFNRDGVGGAIMAAQLAQSRPDGYTLGFMAQGQATIIPNLRRNVPYTASSFDYICQTYETQMGIAVPKNSKFQSLKDLIEAAKAQPKGLSWGDGGIGIAPNLAAREFQIAAGIELRHVPYRQTGDLYRDLLSGQIDSASTAIGTVVSYDVRLLTVYGEKRDPLFPDVPTAKEQGVDFATATFGGIVAPKGLPEAIRLRLSEACAKALATPRFQEFARRFGSPGHFLDTAAFGQRMMADDKAKKELIAKLGLKVD